MIFWLYVSFILNTSCRNRLRTALTVGALEELRLMEESREKLILNSLKEGGKRWSELERELVDSGKMSMSTLSARLKDLEKQKLIRRIMDDSRRPVRISYGLTESCTRIEEKVEEVVEELRKEFRFFREPTVREVATRIGEIPETARSVLYKLAPKTGWREQTVEEAWKEAVEAINMAGWIRWLKSGEQDQELERLAKKNIQNTSDRVLRRAEKIVRYFQELAPKATPSSSKPDFFCSAGLEPWSQETRGVWRNVFQKNPSGSGIRKMIGFGHVHTD